MKKKSLLILLPALMMVLASCNNKGDDQNNNNSDNPVVPTPGGDDTGGGETETGAVTLPSVAHLTITADKMSAEVGETITFTISVDADYEIEYFKINGVDTIITDGKATATMVKGGLNVTASVKGIAYSVNVTYDNTKGSVSVDKQTAKVDEDVTFTVIPNTDYEVDEFKVGEKTITLENGKATVKMVSGGLSATVTFKDKDYPVTLEFNKDRGTLTSNVTNAKVGDEVTFTVSANTDYAVKEFKVNDKVITLNTDGQATVDMVSGGLNAVATFVSTKNYNVTINSATHGSVSANVSQAKVDEDVVLTINADFAYGLTNLVVNGTDIVDQVSDNKVTVKMVENGLEVTPTFNSAVVETSAIDADFQTKVESTDVVNYKLTNDMSATFLPLAKETTNIDLNGKTLTITTKNVLATNKLETDQAKTQVISVKNGKIVVDGTNSEDATNKPKGYYNLFNVAEAKSFELDGVTVTTNNEITFESAAAIHCSNANTITIQDSSLNTKTIFGISTNNLEREVDEAPLKVNITNSDITVSTTNGDNCALITNVNTETNVKIEGSTITGDRQAVIARTGSYEIKNSILKSTEKWLKSKDYVDTCTSSWSSGNEVTSTPLCVGDLNTSAYNYNASIKLENVTFESENSKNIVARQDGTSYTTSVEMDALTYLHTYSATDIASDVSVTTNNVIHKTVSELRQLTATDETNLYVVTANVQSITNSTYGNTNLTDDDGNAIEYWGGYTSASKANYKLSNVNEYYLDTKATNKTIDETYVGKEVTAIGIFSLYTDKNNVKHYQIKNAVTFIEDVTATIDLDFDKTLGNVTLSKTTDVKVGDEVEVTATANEGYKLSSIKVTKHGTTTDITDTKTFVAARTTKVVVEFVDESAPEAKTYKAVFAKNKWTKSISDYTSTFEETIDDLTLSFSNFNTNQKKWDLAKCGPKNKESTAYISTYFTDDKIQSSTIDIGACKYVTSFKLIVASNKDFSDVLETIDLTSKAAKDSTVEAAISSPVKNAYYKYEIQINNTTTTNGVVEIKGLSFTTVAE